MTDNGTLIVTGAGRGIGAAVARLAGAAGWAVVVNYQHSAEAAAGVARAITAAGGRAVAVQGDAGNESDIARLFDSAEREFGPLRGLVNNAGIIGNITRLEDLATDDLLRVFAVNTTGAILCCREAVRRMSTARGGQGGAIVNLSSLAARLGGPNELVHYAASKGAINSLTVGLAREVGEEGIRVNAVAPGLIETDILPERAIRLAATVPMRRTGTTREVAEGIVWLLSPAASYVTGTVMEIGGGR